MPKKKIKSYSFALFSIFLCLLALQEKNCSARSAHRPSYSWTPRLEVHWTQSPTTTETTIHTLESTHLEPDQILKKFDKQFLLSRQLPATEISHRNAPEKTTSGENLSTLINNLVLEIEKQVKEYTDFIILKDKDFNRSERCGLIVLRFKDYPFVLKIFMERPESFVKPYAKGMQPYFFYHMGGGINRHLMGFTRIKNLELIKETIAKDPYWSELIDTPRKWFWLPTEPHFMTIHAYNFNGVQHQEIEIPSVYAIVSDLIIPKRELSIRSKSSRQLGIKLSRIVGNRIDPHMGNFIIEAKMGAESLVSSEQSIDTSVSIVLEHNIYLDPQSERIVLIDTEHFPSLVGLKKPLEFDGYLSWYLQLMSKFATEKLFTTKQYRRQFQLNPPEPYLAL